MVEATVKGRQEVAEGEPLGQRPVFGTHANGGDVLGAMSERLRDIDQVLDDLQARAAIPVGSRSLTDHPLDSGSPLFERLESLCRRACGEAPIQEQASVLETARRLRESADSLASFWRMSALSEEELGRNGTSSGMLLAAIDQVSNDLRLHVAELGHVLRDLRPPDTPLEVSPGAERLTKPITESAAPPVVRGAEATAALRAIEAVSQGGATSDGIDREQIEVARVALASARSLHDGSLSRGKEESRPVFEVLNRDLPPGLHERLAISGLLVPVKGDGKLLPIEQWMALSGKPVAWTAVEPGRIPNPGGAGPERLDLKFPLDGTQPLAVPFGYAIEAYEFRGSDGGLRAGTIERSSLGTHRTAGASPAATSLTVRLVRDPGAMQIDAAAIAEFGRSLPGIDARMDRLSARLVEKRLPTDGSVSQEELRKRAGDIAHAFKEENLVYSTNAFLDKVNRYAEGNTLSFLNGLGCGSCFSLSYQLCSRLNQAGIPAVVAEGNFARDGQRSYLGHPGHAMVIVLSDPPTTFDPTLWTDSSKGLRPEQLEPEDTQKLVELPDVSPERAFAIGRELRTVVIGEPRWTSGGHCLRDDLREEASPELAAAKRTEMFERELREGLAACLERGDASRLSSIIRQHATVMVKERGDPERDALHDALSMALSSDALSLEARGELVLATAQVLEKRAAREDCSALLPYLSALRDPEFLREPAGRSALAALGEGLMQNPSPRVDESWREAANLYLDGLGVSLATKPVKLLPNQHEVAGHGIILGTLARNVQLVSGGGEADPDLTRRVKASWNELERQVMGGAPAILVHAASLAKDDKVLDGLRGMAHLAGVIDPACERQMLGWSRVTKESTEAMAPHLVTLGLLESGIPQLARSLERLNLAFKCDPDLSQHAPALTAAAKLEILGKPQDIASPLDMNPVSQFLFQNPLLLPEGSSRRLALIARAGGLQVGGLSSAWDDSVSEGQAVAAFDRAISSARIVDGVLQLRCARTYGPGMNLVPGEARIDGALRPLLHALKDDLQSNLQLRGIAALESLVSASAAPDAGAALFERWRDAHPSSFRQLSALVLEAVSNDQKEARKPLERAMRATMSDPERHELDAQYVLAVEAVKRMGREETGNVSTALRQEVALEGPGTELVASARFADLSDEQARFVLDRAGRRKENIMVEHSLLDRVTSRRYTMPENPYVVSPSEAGGPRDEVWRRALAFERVEARGSIRDELVRKELYGVMSALPAEGRQRSAAFLTTLEGGRLPTAGATDEVWDRTKYRPGDDTRYLDHAVSARRDELYVKRFRAAPEKSRSNELTIHVDAEMLTSDPREPHANVRSIYGMVAGAVAEGKRVDMRVYFRGALLWSRSADEVAEDFRPPRGDSHETAEAPPSPAPDPSPAPVPPSEPERNLDGEAADLRSKLEELSSQAEEETRRLVEEQTRSASLVDPRGEEAERSAKRIRETEERIASTQMEVQRMKEAMAAAEANSASASSVKEETAEPGRRSDPAAIDEAFSKMEIQSSLREIAREPEKRAPAPEPPLPGQSLFGELWRTGYDVGRLALAERFHGQTGGPLFSQMPASVTEASGKKGGPQQIVVCDDATLAATWRRFPLPVTGSAIVRGAMVERPDPSQVTGVVF